MALLPAWLPLPTAIQMVELFAAASILLGLYYLINKTKAVKWTDMLVAMGIFFVPGFVIMGLEGLLSPIAGAMIIGLMLAYTMAKLDTD